MHISPNALLSAAGQIVRRSGREQFLSVATTAAGIADDVPLSTAAELQQLGVCPDAAIIAADADIRWVLQLSASAAGAFQPVPIRLTGRLPRSVRTTAAV